jgi:hypothetical protein
MGRVLEKGDPWNTKYSRYLSEMMEDLHCYIRMKIKLLGVDCCAVYNADKTKFYFSPQKICKYTSQGSQTVGQILQVDVQ